MRFALPILVASALVGSAMAVDIAIYPNSDICDDDTNGLQCGNIAALTCCHNGGGDIFSARCSGLDTTGVPDQCVIAIGNGPGAAWCTTSLNAAAGNSVICLDPGTSPAATGSFWVNLTGRKRFSRGASAECTQTVKPDKAFFSNGRSFKINYDVPSNITDLLIDMVKTNPGLSQGVPDEVLPYEIAN